MKKTLLLLAVIVGIIFCLTYFQAENAPSTTVSHVAQATAIIDSTTTQWQEVSYWIFAPAAIILIGAGIAAWRKNRDRLFSVISTSVMATFVILVYLSYKDGWLMEGAWREVFYLFAIAFVLLAAAYAKSDKEKTGATLMLGAAFIMLGLSHFLSWQQVSSHLPSWGGGPQVASAPSVQLGVRYSTTLGPNPVELNPGGQYKIWVHEVNQSQCIRVYGPLNQYLGNDCGGSIDLRDTAKFASARGDVVNVEYILSSP